jgi:hypothetical protein
MDDKTKKKINRNIMIDNQINQHGPRMKVSKENSRVTTDHKSTISIYVSKEKYDINGNPDFEYGHIGNLKNIKLSNKEYKYLCDMYGRNYNLIKMVNSNNAKQCEKAMINDEHLYHKGTKYNRDENGVLTVYDSKGNIHHRENLEGDII